MQERKAVTLQSSDRHAKKVTYKDQLDKQDKRAKKAQKRQKHTTEALTTLLKALKQHGEGASSTITALETYVEKCCDAGVYLLDLGQFEEANKVFEDCSSILQDKISARYPILLYKIYYRQAQVMNAQSSHQDALVYLRQAMAMAEEQFRMDGDALACMPAETYLNAAIAFQFIERFSEAIEASEKADQASKRAIMALSEVKQQPQAFRVMSPEEAQNQLMIQLDIEIQSYLIRSQVYEKMNRFEEASRSLAQGKDLLAKHFGAHHPLMSEFQSVDHNIKMQVAPQSLDLDGKSTDDREKEIDLDDISQLLDRRSDLMKRGRVKRVYYQVTEEVQSVDMRGEFADLEEFENRQKAEMNSCVSAQASWMQRQQLVAMRQQQDEQFRIMELLISTQKSAQIQECNQPKLFLPMQYGYQVPPPERQTTEESSSDVSESTEGHVSSEPEPIVEPEPIKVPTPEPSSCSSDSDSMELQSGYDEKMRNYLSEDSESDREDPPAFIARNYDPIDREGRKPFRFAGYDDAFKEKGFKSAFSIIYKPETPRPETPKPVQPIVIPPIHIEPEPTTPAELTGRRRWRELSSAIYIQWSWRRVLLLRKKTQEKIGKICEFYYRLQDRYVFHCSIWKVLVAHTIKKKRVRHERKAVRHRDETEMHEVEDKTTALEEQKIQEKIIMYQVQATCTSHPELGSSNVLINMALFPYEFPYLCDYMLRALTISIVTEKDKMFKIIFKKLEWEIEQQIHFEIRRLVMIYQNREANRRHDNTNRTGGDDIGEFSDTRSNITRIEEIDYESIQIKLAEYAQNGIDLTALRAKIQNEARQLMETDQVTSTEVKQIVHRDIRKERDWTDHIRLNTINYEGPVKTVPVRKPKLRAIVMIQGMIRRFLARRNHAHGPVWKLIFEFVVHQNENYYNVRVFKAPSEMITEEPYLVAATRYLCSRDSFKLRLQQLPYTIDTCRQDMIETVQIIATEDSISDIKFKHLAEKKKEEVIIPTVDDISDDSESEKNTDHEFIDDWEMPSVAASPLKIRYDDSKPGYKQFLKRARSRSNSKVELNEPKDTATKPLPVADPWSNKGSTLIRKFKIYPHISVKFTFESGTAEYKDEHYKVSVVYKVSPQQWSRDSVILHTLPTAINNMVYFLRRFLNVNMKENSRDEIDYVSLGAFPNGKKGKMIFEAEMRKLRDALKLKQLGEKVQEQLKQVTEQHKARLEDQADVRIADFVHVESGFNYIVTITKNVIWSQKESIEVVPYQIVCYKELDPADMDYINLQGIFKFGDQLVEFLKTHLIIYRDEETSYIKYIAIDKLAHLVQEQVAEGIDSIALIIKVQACIRGFLERCRKPKGYVTRFFLRQKDGQRARITVWKAIVERTVRSTKLQTTEKKKHGVVKDSQTKKVDEQVEKEKLNAYQIKVENVYIQENEFQKIILELPPKEVLIDTLKGALEINWKNTFENVAERQGVAPFKVDWITDIKLSKIDSQLINKRMMAKKQIDNRRSLDHLTRKIGRDSKIMWDLCNEYNSGSLNYALHYSSEATLPTSELVQIRARIVDPKDTSDPKQIAAVLTLTVQEVWNLFYPGRAGEDLASLDFVDVLRQISFQKKTAEWDILLSKCCKTLSSGEIIFDEIEFKKNRYTFNPTEVRYQAKEANACRILQKAIKNFLRRVRDSRLRYQKGSAIVSDIFKTHGRWFVYIFRTDLKQEQVYLTVKLRRENEMARDPVIERHTVSQRAIESALQSYGEEEFKLQSINCAFRAKLEESVALVGTKRPADWIDFVRKIVEAEM